VPITSLVLATLAALLHVFFWVLESLRWREPTTQLRRRCAAAGVHTTAA
jgi:uncharacterized membrane protein